MHTKAVVVNKIHQAFALGNKTIPILKGISLSAQSQKLLKDKHSIIPIFASL
jgi:putative ABC transport system ATP-binding protein